MAQMIAGIMLAMWSAWFYYCVFKWESFKEDYNRGPAYWLVAFCISGLFAAASFTVTGLIVFLILGVVNG